MAIQASHGGGVVLSETILSRVSRVHSRAPHSPKLPISVHLIPPSKGFHVRPVPRVMLGGDGCTSQTGFISSQTELNVLKFNLRLQYIFLSVWQCALRTSELSAYETVSNTNTPVSYHCLTTVSYLCVSLTPWLSYTSEEEHLLQPRPPGSRHWISQSTPVSTVNLLLWGVSSDAVTDSTSHGWWLNFSWELGVWKQHTACCHSAK